eukprot:6919411-Prymnesium_polylepis.1
MVGAAAATGRQFAACRWAKWLSFGPRIVAGGRYETPDMFAQSKHTRARTAYSHARKCVWWPLAYAPRVCPADASG